LTYRAKATARGSALWSLTYRAKAKAREAKAEAQKARDDIYKNEE